VNDGWRFGFLGDSAFSVEIEDDAPLRANRRAHALAAILRAARVPGVRDIVTGMRDVVVHVDALHCNADAIERLVREALGAAGATRGGGRPGPAADRGGAVVDVPVVYGGDAGPDLEDVARVCGLDADQVCRRHAAVEYVVCFVGYLPGFAYLGLLDESLRLPRRVQPRPHVPPGSVAIAGEYTGIYPWASPGGWHLIGRTEIALFDVDADPPALLEPGTRVRFVAAHA
jgi:KipI family sensor histidine kinase inhibitor